MSAPESRSETATYTATPTGAVEASTVDYRPLKTATSADVITADGGLVTHPGDTATADTDLDAIADRARMAADMPLPGPRLTRLLTVDVPSLIADVTRLRAERDEAFTAGRESVAFQQGQELGHLRAIEFEHQGCADRIAELTAQLVRFAEMEVGTEYGYRDPRDPGWVDWFQPDDVGNVKRTVLRGPVVPVGSETTPKETT